MANPNPNTTSESKQTLETIPRVLRVIDFGVKWKQLQAGEVLVREGQPSDGCLYVLLHGRARSSIRETASTTATTTPPAAPTTSAGLEQEQSLEQQEEEVVVVADHGRGTLIGETEALTGGRHKAMVQAVRYTSFATLPSSVLGLLIRRHPRVLATLAEHVVEKAAYGSGRSGVGGGARPGYGAAGQRRRRWTGEASAGLDVGVGVPASLRGVGRLIGGMAGVEGGGGSTTTTAGRAVLGDAGAKTILVLPAYVVQLRLCGFMYFSCHVVCSFSRSRLSSNPPRNQQIHLRSFGVPLDQFCRTLEAAMVRARHSVRTITMAHACAVLGVEKPDEASWRHGMDALLLESWLTQQEEQHEVGCLLALIGGVCFCAPVSPM